MTAVDFTAREKKALLTKLGRTTKGLRQRYEAVMFLVWKAETNALVPGAPGLVQDPAQAARLMAVVEPLLAELMLHEQALLQLKVRLQPPAAADRAPVVP